MKRFALAAALFVSLPLISKADPLCASLGAGLDVCLPLSSLDAAFGYNMSSKIGEAPQQALAETTIAKIQDKVSITFGGAKSDSEKAAPYVSATYGIRNPVENETANILSQIRPGVYGGVKEVFDNSKREYFWGFKASTKIW